MSLYEPRPNTAYVDGEYRQRCEAPTKSADLRVRSDAPPERLESRAHRCGVIDEHGQPYATWTLQARCFKHRRQLAAIGDEA